MANNKSAKKRIQIAERNRILNKSYKSSVRTLIKKCISSCETYLKKPTEDGKTLINQSLSAAYSKIDKAVKKNAMHKNNGANQKSRINRIAKKALLSK